jgi:hypothetical protein
VGEPVTVALTGAEVVTVDFVLEDPTDVDEDGTPDCHDGCPNDPQKIAPGVCGCHVPDTDSDNEGSPNCVDECDQDPAKVVAGQCGCGNPDTDTDADGTPDCIDNCKNDPAKTEPGACGCGRPDTDTDGDGIVDCEDNCPDVPNTDQTDEDGDGVGDVCADSGREAPAKCGAGVCPAGAVSMITLMLIAMRRVASGPRVGRRRA